MQHVSSFVSVSPAARKATAVAAYDAACMSPAGADWRTVADLLRAALPASRAKSDDAVPAWFADWKLGKHYQLDSMLVRFTDGIVVRVNVAKASGKQPRVAASCRAAIGFYRAKTRAQEVPAFAYLEDLATGASFDAVTCSRLTADIRRADDPAAAVQARATIDAVERMAREVERRRAGLAVALSDHRILLRKHRKGGAAQGDMQQALRRNSDARVAMWRAAVDGGETDLALMRAALEPSDPTPADRAPIPAPVARDTSPVAEASPVAPVAVSDPSEAWCAAVAPAYADPAESELSGTFEPGMLISAATIVSPDLNAHPVEGIATPTPVEGIEAEAHSIFAENAKNPSATVCENAPDLTTEDAPTLESHTVTAVCLSLKARDALFARIMDGTFPAGSVSVVGGAWRVTVQDARDCADIPSVRWAGLPRKAYTRRDASPVAMAA